MKSKKTFKQVSTSIILSLVLITSAFSHVLAAPYAPGSYYKQSEKIIQNYFPKPKNPICTPAFTEGKEDFTSHEEMMEFIYGLQRDSKYMKVSIIGYSQEGRPIPILIFSKPSYAKAADVLKLNKPVVWLQGQIHGNEPAGGEAMLAVARNLGTGKFGEKVLDNVSVVILPRFNGDGAYYFDRKMVNKLDSNRDHLKFDNLETIIVHKTFNQFMPEVVVDAHEYGVFSAFKSVGKKGSLTAYDVLISSAKNLNIPKEVRSVSDSLFVNNVQKDLASQDYTSHMYYTTSRNGNKFTIYEAGTDAKIGRNAYGLQPSISFLVETRGIGIGKENFERRVMSHIITSENIIKTTADNAKFIKDTVDSARRKITMLGKKVDPLDKIVITSESVNMPKSTLDIIDVETGKKVKLDVDVFSSTKEKPLVERVRPNAYILPPTYHEVAKKLSYSGVSIKKLSKDVELPVEAFKITNKVIDTNYYEGHLRNTVTVKISKEFIKFNKGSYVFSMDQPNANIIAMTLEPDAVDSFVKFNIIPAEINDEIPIYRYMENQKLDAYTIKVQ
ncbi:M14 family metallopeptidase [Clostridium rectalis]|uniref:M14 family metallopeptidase n=1 Tax=Clostridium rectalis TaxID=2040295 RepID=UPI000F644D42|nr:M14 family metallopeptidase [Clostridium rectalis]